MRNAEREKEREGGDSDNIFFFLKRCATHDAPQQRRQKPVIDLIQGAKRSHRSRNRSPESFLLCSEIRSHNSLLLHHLEFWSSSHRTHTRSSNWPSHPVLHLDLLSLDLAPLLSLFSASFLPSPVRRSLFLFSLSSALPLILRLPFGLVRFPVATPPATYSASFAAG